MSTFVLPLPGADGSVSVQRPTYSLDNYHDLIEYINNSHTVQQQLEIDEYVAHGIWKDCMENYIVVADFSDITIGEAINKPSVDIAMQMEWGKYKPTKQEFEAYRDYIKTRLCCIINKATEHSLSKQDIQFSVRRKTSKQAKLYKVFRLR